MRFSTEKEITRYPIGTQTTREPMTVSGRDFLQYSLGGDLYVWRTPDLSVEIGQRGNGGTYYVKFNLHILEASFATLRGAMQAAVKLSGMTSVSKTGMPKIGQYTDVQNQYAAARA